MKSPVAGKHFHSFFIFSLDCGGAVGETHRHMGDPPM